MPSGLVEFPASRRTSNPDMSGNPTPISITSGARSSTASIAAPPEPTSPTMFKSVVSWHSCVKAQRAAGSSSTMRSLRERGRCKALFSIWPPRLITVERCHIKNGYVFSVPRDERCARCWSERRPHLGGALGAAATLTSSRLVAPAVGVGSTGYVLQKESSSIEGEEDVKGPLAGDGARHCKQVDRS